MLIRILGEKEEADFFILARVYDLCEDGDGVRNIASRLFRWDSFDAKTGLDDDSNKLLGGQRCMTTDLADAKTGLHVVCTVPEGQSSFQFLVGKIVDAGVPSMTEVLNLSRPRPIFKTYFQSIPRPTQHLR